MGAKWLNQALLFLETVKPTNSISVASDILGYRLNCANRRLVFVSTERSVSPTISSGLNIEMVYQTFSDCVSKFHQLGYLFGYLVLHLRLFSVAYLLDSKSPALKRGIFNPLGSKFLIWRMRRRFLATNRQTGSLD